MPTVHTQFKLTCPRSLSEHKANNGTEAYSTRARRYGIILEKRHEHTHTHTHTQNWHTRTPTLARHRQYPDLWWHHWLVLINTRMEYANLCYDAILQTRIYYKHECITRHYTLPSPSTKQMVSNKCHQRERQVNQSYALTARRKYQNYKRPSDVLRSTL